MVNKGSIKRGPKQAAKPRKQRVKQRRRGAAADAPAIVNTGATVRSKAKRSMRMSGTDRLAGFTLEPGKPVGTILYDRFVSVQMFPSLAERARTFQRVKYSSLSWRLVSESGTNVTGGVAAAFIKDANALVADGEEGLETLMTQSGAKATKAWQELTISANSGETFYITPGSDLRLYSPGKFVIMTSGQVDKNSPFSLYCDWVVELSRPGRNAPQKLVEQPVVTSSYIISGVESIESRNWDPTTGAETTPDHPQDMFKALANVENTDFTSPRYYRLPHPAAVNWAPEDGGDTEVITVRFVQLHLVDSLLIGRLCRLPSGKETDFFSDTLSGIVLMQGDILEPVSPYEFAGNVAVDICPGTLIRFEECIKGVVDSVGHEFDRTRGDLQEIRSAVDLVTETIRSEGPYLGPATFEGGISSLDNTVVVSANNTATAVVAANARVEAAVAASGNLVATATTTAGAATAAAIKDLASKLEAFRIASAASLYEITTGIKMTNEQLTALSGQVGSLKPVAFPFGPNMLTNGGAYSYDTGTIWRTWRIQLRSETPAAIEQTYRLYVLSATNNVVIQYNCQFVTPPQQQGEFCVALVATTSNGRWVLWRS